MGGVNKKGRSKDKQEHFTKTFRFTMETESWRALPTRAQALYPFLKLEWKGPRYNNNGSIRLSLRHAAEKMGTSINTAAKAFHDLQAKGFIVVTREARLGIDGAATGACFEITELAMPRSDSRPRKLYRDWQPNREYPVITSAANNPSGRNGKEKPLLRNHDRGVITLKTKPRSPPHFR